MSVGEAASGTLETLHFPAELPDEETCDITRAFSVDQQRTLEPCPISRACSLPDEALPEQQNSDVSRASSSSSWAISTADFRSKIRVLRQQRNLASSKGKAQAFQDAYDKSRQTKLSSSTATPISSTSMKLPTPLTITRSTACPPQMNGAPSFKQSYEQARMRKLELAVLSLERAQRDTPLITSAMMTMDLKRESKSMETLKSSPQPTPD